MPKVTLMTIVPYVQLDGSGNKKIITDYPQEMTVHSELISMVKPHWNIQAATWIDGINDVFLKDGAGFVTVKQPYSQLVALMNENAYSPISVGSGDTVDQGGGQTNTGGNTGSGATGSITYTSTTVKNFNGACSGTANQTYKHNGAAGSLPAAGNRVFLNDGSTALSDGYYGVTLSGSAPTHSIKVVGGFVQTGWPLVCTDLGEIYP